GFFFLLQVSLSRIVFHHEAGLLSWDIEATGCNLNGLESVCSGISTKHLSDSDVLIQHSTESLGVEVLVNPTVSTLKQCVTNLFSTSTGHKHLIHAGYTFAGSGSWILQNGTFSFDEFLEIFQQADVQSQKRCNINVHCAEVGPWNVTNFAKDIFTKVANVTLNPPAKVSNVPGSVYLIDCLNKMLNSQALEEMMEASPLVGNIRFNRPTLYMFPAGQGDCALFGINGFNMLIDGGFNRKPCSWEFIRHLDRLDAVLVTRLCENNLCGMSTLMKRKALNNTYPQIGYVFCNIAEGKTSSPKDEMAKDKDDLIVSVVNEGHNFIQTLNELKLKPHQCWRDSSVEPFVLYHKVGHGTLEMHVLSPPRDSKEMKEFLMEWSSYKETFSCIKSGLKGKILESTIPLSHATSICAILVWRPADPKDTITRILFPGSAPQNKIFESLEKLKSLDILNQPVVTKASLTSILVAKPVSNKIEKPASRASIPNRRNTASPALSVSSIASRNGDVGGFKKDIKETKKVIKEVKKDIKEVKKEVKKDIKRDSGIKELKKDVKADVPQKKEVPAKKDTAVKETKKETKEVKKIVKKENKEVKTVADKKPELKNISKKPDISGVTKSVTEVKKSPTVRKTTTLVKKDSGKPSAAVKTVENKKPLSKVSELKASKDISNKKAVEAKAVTKTKPKTASPATKTTTKPKPAAVPKAGSKMTKAVAASSVVASAVAVTVAALELNEKKEEVPDEIDEEIEKEVEILDEPKDSGVNEKSEEEVNVSPLPPEALSPTPSDSVSLTPSDTLSSAPLETVSPTPPLANEPVSTEEKEVNEIKEIEQDIIPYDKEYAPEGDVSNDDNEKLEKEYEEINPIEIELAKQQSTSDLMATSFVAEKDLNGCEVQEEVITETKIVNDELVPSNATNFENKELEVEDVYEKGADEDIEKCDNYQKEEHIEKKEINIDNQLAGLSMEGSFCAGVNSYEKEENTNVSEDNLKNIVEDNVSDEINVTDATAAKEDITKDYQDEIPKQNDETTANSSEILEEEYRTNVNDEEMITHKSEETMDALAQHSEDYKDESHEQLNKNKEIVDELVLQSQDIKDESDEQLHPQHVSESNIEQETSFEVKTDEHRNHQLSTDLEVNEDSNIISQNTTDEQYDKESDIQYLEESIHSHSNFDQPMDIVHDVEMQESSVDEPEEIVRKESSVSITLNDEPESDYIDSLRRKSGTESEDDVDIQNYMTKEHRSSVEQDKLYVKQDSESDDEDVVKSPTPHAVVDYEGHNDDIIRENKINSDEEYETLHNDKEHYATEKQDFDEKDHDSAEEQDTDDGEMIRHPTPPMKYSEDEMRDPIGQHFITAPGLKEQPDIAEPLYEETEDSRSDASPSPVIDQPVFSNAVEADFPEFVTVSGGTTPSEPQSPKSTLDSKKFASESGMMEVLSEHDCSESSTHSPLCQESNTAFDLQVNEHILGYESESNLNNKIEQASDVSVADLKGNVDDQSNDFGVKCDTSLGIEENLDTRKRDAFSDDEICSQTDKSETHSEEKTDSATDDKSDAHPDDKSDAHPDDKSDAHHDDRSDVHSDKSDAHSDDGSDIADDNKSDVHPDDKSDVHDDRSDNQFDRKSDILEDNLGNTADIHEDENTQFHHPAESEFESSQKSNIPCDVSHRDDDSLFTKENLTEDVPDVQQYGELESSHDKTINIHHDEDELIKNKSDILQEHEMRMSEVDASRVEDDIQSNTHADFECGISRVGDDVQDNTQANVECDNLEVQTQNELDFHKGDIMHDELNMYGDMNSVIQGSEEIQNHDISIQNNSEISTKEPSMPEDGPGTQLDHFIVDDGVKNELNREEMDAEVNRDLEDHFDNACHSHSTVENEVNQESGYSEVYKNSNEAYFVKEEYESITSSSNATELDAPGEDKYGMTASEEYGNEMTVQRTDPDEDVIQQNAENYSVTESKILSEVTETHQYEAVSKCEENTHISDETFIESSFNKNVICDQYSEFPDTLSEETNIGQANFSYVSSKIETVTSSSTYEDTTAVEECVINSKSDDEVNEKYALYSTESLVQEKDAENSTSSNGVESTSMNFPEASHFDVPKELNSNINEDVHYSYETSHSEVYSQLYQGSDIVSEHQDAGKMSQSNGYDIAAAGLNFDASLPTSSVADETAEPSFRTVNGKDQSAWDHSSSEYETHVTETSSIHTEAYTINTAESCESSYIINSRFHSDSPEDNIMRNDSSPEVPYPVDTTTPFAELKNSSEIHTESYVHSKDDYPKNINFSNAGSVPLSPNNKTRNSNHDDPYGESSEDEDSSSLPGTVSPYAYTNKAYTREEGDVDGNHIYKESIAFEQSSEIIKQVEFDGNNPQPLETHQMGSVVSSFSQGYQDIQYSGDTNYDFRLEEWGKPMGLPTPPDNTQKTLTKKTDKAVTKTLNKSDANGKAYSPSVSTKLSSPLKKPKPKTAKESSISPVYVDLAYVPHHGDPQYCDVEYFKKIRARYYVFSGINPSKEVLNALLEARKTWNEDLEITIIPTYETDILGYWMAQNQDDLAEYSIEVAPSASRCTVNLQDHETSCAAYRLEF
ncbi:microtubule-associated protein futsch-like, partial [Stegodyphus dumicola]|uniref:microtubule-associated protein futsch-like n=1 Tax=Stegodyphus dumicola TaxID=202533 RepID=UPI0015AF2F5C